MGPTREWFDTTNWRCTFEEYMACYCPECDKEDCKHRECYRRVPRIDGGLALCPRLKEIER